MNILKHSIYNALGLGLPLVVAVFTVPILISHLGNEKFGVLTLIWAVVSYFGLFDFGLGRALTQQLSVLIENKKINQIGELIFTSMFLMFVLGIFAGLLLATLAFFKVNVVVKTSDSKELTNALYFIAATMPAIIATSGFRGILESRNEFGIVNLIRLPMGLFTFLGPICVLYLGESRLDYITATLGVGRIFACVVHGWYAWKVLPADSGAMKFNRALVKPLCISGGWLTVSNIVSPFMGYVDRFLIGVLVSASAVTLYVAPLEIVTKLWIIPGALTAVLFPKFAIQTQSSSDEALVLLRKSVQVLFATLLPITLGIALFADNLLSVWINREFAEKSHVLLQIFSFGILINCLAHIPFTLIQGANRPKVTALTHLLELPIYLMMLWLLTIKYGVIGASFAWLFRIVLDTQLLFVMVNRIFKKSSFAFISLPNIKSVVLVFFAFAGIYFESIWVRFFWLLLFTCLISLPTLIPTMSQIFSRDFRNQE